MTENQTKILDMLAEGKISADEAERLLAAMNKPSSIEEKISHATDFIQEHLKPLEHLEVLIDSDEDARSTEERDDTFTVGDSPKLIVKGFNGRVEVKAGTVDDTVSVHARLRNPSRIDYSVSQDGDTIRIEAQRKGRGRVSLFGFLGHRTHASIFVTTPRKTDVELSTSNGRIDLQGTEGIGKLHTSNGRFNIDNFNGDLDASTSNSRIEVKNTEGSGTLNTSNGRISMENTRGNYDAKTSNGSISFRGQLAAGSHNQLRTSNGSVRVELEGEPNVSIDARTTNGQIHCDLPITTESESERRHLIGKIGDGGAELTVQTTNGSVTIE